MSDVRHYLQQHLETEDELVEEYAALLEDPTTDPAVHYLVRLVVEDERRHHQILRDIVDSMDEGELGRPRTRPVPPLPSQRSGDPRLADITTRFLAAERADRRDLRRLQRAMHSERHTSLWPLLLALMERDTAKHMLVLEFIREQIAPYSRIPARR